MLGGEGRGATQAGAQLSEPPPPCGAALPNLQVEFALPGSERLVRHRLQLLQGLEGLGARRLARLCRAVLFHRHVLAADGLVERRAEEGVDEDFGVLLWRLAQLPPVEGCEALE